MEAQSAPKKDANTKNDLESPQAAKQKKNAAKKHEKEEDIDEEELDEEDVDEDLDEDDEDDEEFDEDEDEEETDSKTNKAAKAEAQYKKTLFIKNLPQSTTEDDIKALSPDIQDVRIDVSHLKGEKNPKYAILDFANGEVAARTLELLKDKQVNGVDVVADFIGGKTNITYTPPAMNSTSDLLKLYVTGFGRDITMEQLKDMFPTSNNINLPLNPTDGNKPIGYAFIHFADEATCKASHDSMQDYVYQSRTLVVMYGKKSNPEGERAFEELKRSQPMPKRGRPKKVKLEPEPAPEGDEEDEEEEEEDDDENDDDDDDDDN